MAKTKIMSNKNDPTHYNADNRYDIFDDEYNKIKVFIQRNNTNLD